MGSWGTGLFSNDIAADLRDDLRDLVADGLTPSQATARLAEEYDITSSGGDANDFWLALAVSQHKLGRIDATVRSQALALVDDPAELERWPPNARRRRAVVLQKTKDLLSGEPPQPKPVRRRARVDTRLEAGQHVRYPLGSGKPDVVLRVLDIHEDHGGRYPVVVALNWSPGSNRQLCRAHRLAPMTDRFGVQRPGNALGFMIAGPDDPAELIILDPRSDAKTPTVGLARSQWVTTWAHLTQFFGPDGRPRDTLEAE